MIEEPIHDRAFVKCMCGIASTEALSPIIYNDRRLGRPAIIPSHELGWSNLSIPRCSSPVSFEKVYKQIRNHFFSEPAEKDDILPHLNLFFSNNGHGHLNCINSLNGGASFVTVNMNESETYDSIVFERNAKNLDMVVTLRTCEMIYCFPTVSAYFNLFLKIVCMMTATIPGKLTFVITVPYICHGEEEVAVSVYHRFNSGTFFETCDKELSVSVSKDVITRNEAILAGNNIEKWSLASLAEVKNLIQPDYFQFS